MILDDDVSLPDGTEVTVVVRADLDLDGDAMSEEERKRYLDALHRIDAIPNENPGDTFRGADHDRVLYEEGP